MNEGDRENLREAASSVEAAEERVLGMLGVTHEARRAEDRMTPEEMGELREISSNLRAACTLMWSMTGEG